ncbi:proline-rich protein 2-like [Physeter macrocephalus]|uniref:Proline-rich protein 2-like n=1 Tax=Physeter macrocephalus TaxID=9755 RepID=A0A2Y9TE97_PHYMC|nr:proline-rich protein 2-like [Physeter catodon]|eukprot:XP_023988638.1 proline-rich protein 2-like [Physeter catodon]
MLKTRETERKHAVLSPTPGIPGSATAQQQELKKLPRREHQRRTSPHQDPTGNGGPRNGDYVLLGGAERGPPPPPTTRSRDLVPRALPPPRERQSNGGSPDPSSSPAPASGPGRERPSAPGPTQREWRRSLPPSGAARRPPLLPTRPSSQHHKTAAHPTVTSLATPRSLQYRSADCRYTLREMAEVGGGETRNVSSQNRPTTKQPQPPPSSGETGLRPSPPRAVRPAPFLTGQGYRPYAAAPPQPLTARQRTSVGPHRPPRALLPRRRARLAAPATAVARGRSDWPKAASIKALEEATAPPPPAPPFRL